MPWSLAVTSDNGFAVVGSIDTPSNGTADGLQNSPGQGVWCGKKTLGTPEDDEFRTVRVLNDGSIIAAGHRFSSTTRCGSRLWRDSREQVHCGGEK